MRNNNNYYSSTFFIIYVPSQQTQGQLQKQHSTDTNKYITENEKHDDDSRKASLRNSTA
jgi:hypothetical protein